MEKKRPVCIMIAAASGTLQAEAIRQVAGGNPAVLFMENRTGNRISDRPDIKIIDHPESPLPPENAGMDILLLEASLLPYWSQEILSVLQDCVYQSQERGTVIPLMQQGASRALMAGGLTDGIPIDAQYHGCLYLKGSAIASFYEHLTCADFLNPADILKKIIQIGLTHVLCEALCLPGNGRQLVANDMNRYQIESALINKSLQYKTDNSRPNLLYLVQADFREDASNNIGGTQLHVKDLVQGMREQYNVFVAARNSVFLQLTAYLPEDTLTLRFQIGAPGPYPKQYSHTLRDIYENTLRAFRISLLHIHHTYGLSTDIFEIASGLHIPIVLTLHDFYGLCPTIKMFNHTGECCIGKENREMCSACLRQEMDIDKDISYIEQWRNRFRRCLELCDKILVPSQNAGNIYLSYFPQIADKITVIEHGYDLLTEICFDGTAVMLDDSRFRHHIERTERRGFCTRVEGWALMDGADNSGLRTFIEAVDRTGKKIHIPTNKLEREDVAAGDRNYLKTGFIGYIPGVGLAEGKLNIRIVIREGHKLYTSSEYRAIDHINQKKEALRVAFIGGLSPAKGSQEIYKIITEGPQSVNWHIFGGIDDADLHHLRQDNLIKTGFYHRDELKLYFDLHKIDVVCILSLWPETFCYTLSEAVGYRRPVIATEIGALGERTQAMGCGWTLPVRDISQNVIRLVREIQAKGNDYEEKMRTVNSQHLKTVREMNNEYEQLYYGLCKDGPLPVVPYNVTRIFNAYVPEVSDSPKQPLRGISPEEYESYIIQLENEIRNIRNSRSFRLALKISRIWNRVRCVGKRRE